MAKPKPKKISIEQRRSIYCVMNGHSNIVKTCFGYVHCARCGDQIGDALGGVYSNENVVISGHACKECKANWKRLTKKDKVLVPREILAEYMPVKRASEGEKKC